MGRQSSGMLAVDRLYFEHDLRIALQKHELVGRQTDAGDEADVEADAGAAIER